MPTSGVSDAWLRRELRLLLVVGSKQAGLAMVSHLQLKLNRSAREAIKGKKRKGGRRGWRYVASRPGEPPRKRTGTLQRSVATRTITSGNEVVTQVGSNVPYAPYLEFGTRKMAPRPWLRVGLAEFRQRFDDIVMNYVRSVRSDLNSG